MNRPDQAAIILPKERSALFWWWPALVQMTLIYFASSNVGSAKNTSRIIGPLLRWLFGSVSDETVWNVQFYIRKCGHLTGYAILGILCWRAVAKPARWLANDWQTRVAFQAWLIATLYAGTDEWHQSFVPSREGSVWDVLLDSFGVFVGLCVVRQFCHWRTARKLKQFV